MTRAKLRHLVDSRRWTRPHRGIYLAHNGPITLEQRVWIGVLSAGGRHQAWLAGTSALRAGGLKGLRDTTIHVYIPMTARDSNPPAGVVVHRTSTLEAIDCSRGLPSRTSPARSVVDAAQWASTDANARAIIASAFQQRLVDRPAIDEVLHRVRRIRRRALIASTAHDASGGSESISELDLLQLCRQGKLPAPTRQSVVTDARGRRRYRDAYFERWRVHVEIDGGQHMDVSAWWSDMKRQNDMWTTGDRVLRFPAWAIRSHPDDVIDQIRTALNAAGWRG